jgi:hypothetical protein
MRKSHLQGIRSQVINGPRKGPREALARWPSDFVGTFSGWLKTGSETGQMGGEQLQ